MVDDIRNSEAYLIGHVNGMNDALSGVQQLFTHPDGDAVSDIMLADSDTPLANIQFDNDPGDPSVGLSGWFGWVLAEDQQGTVIEAMVKRIAELEADAERYRHIRNIIKINPGSKRLFTNNEDIRGWAIETTIFVPWDWTHKANTDSALLDELVDASIARSKE